MSPVALLPEQVNTLLSPAMLLPDSLIPLSLCVSKECREPLALCESGFLGNNTNMISDLWSF